MVSTEMWPTKEWQISSLEEQDIGPERLAEGLENTKYKRVPTSSFLIVRNGALVWETYGEG